VKPHRTIPAALLTAVLGGLAACTSHPPPRVPSGPPAPGWTEDGMYFAHAATAIIVGTAFTLLKWRGPLEWAGHAANRIGRGERIGQP